MKQFIFFVFIFLSGCSHLGTGSVIGVGGYEYCEESRTGTLIAHSSSCSNNSRVYIKDIIKEYSPNANGVSIWITRDWKNDWYKAEDIQEKVINRGFTPIFIFYWFADDISPEFIEENKDQYFVDLRRFVWLIKQLKGPKIVILNPEFNENGAEAYEPFNDLLLESIEIVRQSKETQVGFCVGDFGDYSKVVDIENWKSFHPSIHRAVKQVDFIAFQEMRGTTKNSHEDILKTPDRALEFSIYLTETYNKPTFFAYLALPSYGENGIETQGKVYQRMSELMPEFVSKGNLIGINTFHLVDVPYHIGYFGKAEKHFGLIDALGQPKPALEYFRKLEF
jgi:hypothetical protein